MRSESLDWKRISIAIALLILVRGVFVLCVLPPFEGWDEYQHIAYIVYFKEHRALPRAGVSTIPDSIQDLLKRYPHAPSDSAQTAPRGWGTKTYDEFWAGKPDSLRQRMPLALYETQQSPLYYLVAAPVWILFSRFGDLAAIYALRLLNVLFLAVAAFIFLQALGPCISNLRHKLIIGLLLGTYPLYVITGARISNCALSILFGSLTFYFLLRAVAGKGKPIHSLIIASCWLAVGVLTKATLLTMIPVLVVTIAVCVYRRRLGVKELLKALAIFGVALVLFLVPLCYYTYKTTGGLDLMAQHRDFRMRGQGFFWVYSYAFLVPWNSMLQEWVFVKMLWVSGWSFLVLPGWFNLPYQYFMYLFWFLVIGIGLKRGWGKEIPFKRPVYLFDSGRMLIFATMVISMVAGLAYFVTLSLADYGAAAYIPSYFMIALPAWTTLLYQAAIFLGARVAFWFGQILIGFYVVGELIGTLYCMPPAFTATKWSSMETWSRLAQLHPVFPSPWFILPCLAVIMALLLYLHIRLWKTEPEVS
jgi:hypothetical protein